ncbi:NDR1/HIN1-like protein 10 [Corylus avellana]|uniref:NDR1/HIN1-like protein 10 n=1 Tax=Corylus avellana TaxID=13451 RepID=UPI001E214E87|nr:NDR1/HIN1-like protein 10 [Corylus avellana]
MQDPSRPITGYPAAPNGFPPPQYGAAYPYVAPPPQQQPYRYQNQYRPASSRPFMRRFLSAMIISFVVMGVVILVLWLVLRPRFPVFRVESLSLSKFSTASNSSSSITGTWNARFAVYNPNKKMSISYDVVESGLFYGSELISKTRLPPFKQGKRNQTVLNAAFSAVDSYVDRRVVNGINGDRARGSVSFNVEVEARVQFRAGGWRVRSRWLRVWCQSLAVGLSSNSSGSGNLIGAPRDCRVAL